MRSEKIHLQLKWLLAFIMAVSLLLFVYRNLEMEGDKHFFFAGTTEEIPTALLLTWYSVIGFLLNFILLFSGLSKFSVQYLLRLKKKRYWLKRQLDLLQITAITCIIFVFLAFCFNKEVFPNALELYLFTMSLYLYIQIYYLASLLLSSLFSLCLTNALLLIGVESNHFLPAVVHKYSFLSYIMTSRAQGMVPPFLLGLLAILLLFLSFYLEKSRKNFYS